VVPLGDHRDHHVAIGSAAGHLCLILRKRAARAALRSLLVLVDDFRADHIVSLALAGVWAVGSTGWTLRASAAAPRGTRAGVPGHHFRQFVRRTRQRLGCLLE